MEEVSSELKSKVKFNFRMIEGSPPIHRVVRAERNRIVEKRILAG